MIRAMTHNEKLHSTINLGQGYPDFDPPKILLEALSKTAFRGPHQYALTHGSENFRRALAKKQSRFMNRTISSDSEILATCGSTEAMMVALLTLIDSGDRVIVFTPYYENYVSQARLAGAEIDFVKLKLPNLCFDADELESAFRKRPKAIIICNPSNPTGKVFTFEELHTIAGLAEKYDTYVITDEVYEHILYDGLKHIYFATLPKMWERTITCGSLSKTYAITGWRLGYIIANEEFLQSAKRVHDYLTVCAPAPLQEAVISGLEMGDEYYADLQKSYQRKKDLFLTGLRQLRLSYIEPQGAYYVLVDTSPFHAQSDLDFCMRLISQTGVISVPSTSFQQEKTTGTARFHFAKKESTLNDALNRLEKINKISFK
ncbi:MAG TPA: pyridoxal phosphate-dependent aminotransferase [Ruminiclostridium sp.]